MVTSHLMGGLGNQMFQIAVAYAYARKYDYELGFDLGSCQTHMQGNPATQYAGTIFRNVPTFNETTVFSRYHEERSHAYSEVPDKGDDLIFKGYFQSEKYFVEYADQIVKLFKLEEERLSRVHAFMYAVAGTPKVVAVHVRRGDYLKNPDIHPTCSIGYYEKAMGLFPNHQFIFMSDDIDWCKENFKGGNIHYSSYKNELDDLAILVQSNHRIIANSTFSWWGAYLGETIGSKVVAPKLWLGPNGPQDTDDIVPERWVKV